MVSRNEEKKGNNKIKKLTGRTEKPERLAGIKKKRVIRRSKANQKDGKARAVSRNKEKKSNC